MLLIQCEKWKVCANKLPRIITWNVTAGRWIYLQPQMLTGVEKTFSEGLLLFLVFNTCKLRKIAEHFISHDHHSAAIMPVTKQLTATPIIFDAAQLVHLHSRIPRVFVSSHASTHAEITYNNDRSQNRFNKAVFTFLFIWHFTLIMTE